MPDTDETERPAQPTARRKKKPRWTWSNAVLAVDGGGTNCRLALEAAGERHVLMLGPANVSTDMGLAAATIRDGLLRMASECAVDFEALCSDVRAQAAECVAQGHAQRIESIKAATAARTAVPVPEVKFTDVTEGSGLECGNWSVGVYAADFDGMNALVSYLTDNCCGGRPCAPAAKKRKRAA